MFNFKIGHFGGNKYVKTLRIFGVHDGVALYPISRYNGSLYSGTPLYLLV